MPPLHGGVTRLSKTYPEGPNIRNWGSFTPNAVLLPHTKHPSSRGEFIRRKIMRALDSRERIGPHKMPGAPSEDEMEARNNLEPAEVTVP